MRTALARAISAAGSQTRLATELTRLTGRTYRQGHISNWVARGRPPANIVIEIEHLTGVSRTELRPDVFAEISPARATLRPRHGHGRYDVHDARLVVDWKADLVRLYYFYSDLQQWVDVGPVTVPGPFGNPGRLSAKPALIAPPAPD